MPQKQNPDLIKIELSITLEISKDNDHCVTDQFSMPCPKLTEDNECMIFGGEMKADGDRVLKCIECKIAYRDALEKSFQS